MRLDSLLRASLTKWVGGLLAALSLWFVVLKLRDSWNALESWNPPAQLLTAVIVGSLAYGLLNILLSIAWHLLVQAFDGKELRAGTSYRIYARSQIAKYVPGNVLQLAGRHVLSYRAGSGHAAPVAAAFFEVAGLLAASGTVALSGFAFFSVRGENILLLSIIGLGIAGVALLAAAATRARLRRHLSLTWKRPVKPALLLLGSFLLYLLFFLGSGAVFLGVVAALGHVSDPSLAGAVVGAFALSWMAGFLTPGAPAGLGVREAVLLAGLNGRVESVPLLIGALALRIITVCGDALFFASSFVSKGDAAPPGVLSD